MDILDSLLPIRAKAVTLRADDGVELAGFHAHAEGSKRLVIVVHGLRRSHLAMVGRWEAVFPDLASVFFLDLRGHGLSSRRSLVTFGDREARDIKAAMDHFKNEYETIILWGHSMGAAASLKYAGNGGKPSALILEGMYHSFDDAIDVRANLWHTPKYPAVPLIKFIFRHLMRIDFNGLTMPPILKRLTDMPILLVQSREDEKVPMTSFEELRRALGPRGKAIVFEQGNHDSIYRTNREAYIRAVREFIENI
ncbi:MAG: lysophospholipase [Nitrospinota bacterium]|nr:lysophospholipase [Nitrospinota bacterium]